MENKKSLFDEELSAVSSGMIVDDGDGKKYWLVRQNGTVISLSSLCPGRNHFASIPAS